MCFLCFRIQILPSAIHFIVPPNFRKVPPKGVALHKDELRSSDVEKRDGLPVTKALRTVFDLAGSNLDEERLAAVTEDAIKKGLIRTSELLSLLAAVPADIDPANQAILQLVARE